MIKIYLNKLTLLVGIDNEFYNLDFFNNRFLTMAIET